jgi:hypothetical protein
MEGESERAGFGIDGTMGDAQDIPHPFVSSVHGDYCVVCGLAQTYYRHSRALISDNVVAGDAG